MKTFGKTVAIMLAAVSAAGCCERQTQESQNDKVVVFEHIILCQGQRTVNKIPVLSEFIQLIIKHLNR